MFIPQSPATHNLRTFSSSIELVSCQHSTLQFTHNFVSRVLLSSSVTRPASSRSTSVRYTKCLRSHVIVIDMLVEGRIKQPPSSPSRSERCPPLADHSARGQSTTSGTWPQVNSHRSEAIARSHHHPPVSSIICTILILILVLLITHPLGWSVFWPSHALVALSSIIIVRYYHSHLFRYLKSLPTALAAPGPSSSCMVSTGVERNKTSVIRTSRKKKSYLCSAHAKRTISLAAMFLTTLITFHTISPTMSDSSILADLQHKHSARSFDSGDAASQLPSSSPSSSSMQKLFQEHEKRFLKMLGFDVKPRPPRDHKVHPRMLDFYNLIVDRQLTGLLQDDDELDKQTLNSVMISSDDLSDQSQLSYETDHDGDDDESADRFVALSLQHAAEEHHRVPRVRRQMSEPRFVLRGDVNTMTSHPLSTRKLDKINHRIKRSVPIAEEKVDDLLQHEAHLRFDVDLRPGEYLQGAELQLYLHSLLDLAGDATWQAFNQLARHNNFWPLIHKDEDKKEEERASMSHLMRVNLYHVLQPLNESHLSSSSESAQRPAMKLIDTQMIDVREPAAFVSFDVMPAVEYWVRHYGSNHGLYLTLVDSSGAASAHSSLVVLNPEDSNVQSHPHPDKAEHEWAELRPHLFTYTSDQASEQRARPSVRVKRNTRDDGRGGNTERTAHRKSNNNRQKRKHYRSKQKYNSAHRHFCKRYKLYFDFKEMGWSDWVVAPPGIQAYQCGGECSFPMPTQLNATNHAIIQALVNSKNTNVVPSPCCVPTDLSPVSLLYSDNEEKMVVKNYPNMVVEGCGCA